MSVDKKRKSVTVAYTLWVVGCVFGVHRAYLGRPISATIMALLTLAGVALLIASLSGLIGGYLEMAQIASGGASGAITWADSQQTQGGARLLALSGGGILIFVIAWCVADLILIPKMARNIPGEKNWLKEKNN